MCGMRTRCWVVLVMWTLGSCAPAHPGEAGLLFGWDPVGGWYNPALAACSVEISLRWTDLYGEEHEGSESFSWDDAGFRQDATWEGGCRTRWGGFTVLCDRHGFPVDDGVLTWDNTVRGGTLVSRRGRTANDEEIRQDFTWEAGLLQAVEESSPFGEGRLEVTRDERGWPLSFTSEGPWNQGLSEGWSEGSYTYDDAGRLTERSFEGGVSFETYTYEGDSSLPTSGVDSYSGSSEADSSTYARTYLWSCPPR